ncbi:hypothetical protein [Archangium lipolyticum]|uniref:hypothetical protein n=1 Tax=Archangium lipolyticum TaxID=2970465 RepID=UPI002149F1D9|nr:hypothetical protein [Archangium lipolyticum]
MANPCQSIIDKIRALEREKSDLIRDIHDADEGGPVHKPPVHDPEFKELTRQITQETKKLNACLIKNASPVPMVLSVESLSSSDANDPGPFESDEPYVLVYVLNLPSLTNPTLPRPKVVLVGPLSEVDAGESHKAPANVLWGIDGVPRPIPKPEDIILLVALVENDFASAASVRTLVEVTMGAVLAVNLPSVGNRQEFVRRLRNGMEGAIQTAVKAGFPDRDDLIDSVKELRLGALDVAHAFHFGGTPLELSFKGDDSHYRVTFRLKRA